MEGLIKKDDINRYVAFEFVLGADLHHPVHQGESGEGGEGALVFLDVGGLDAVLGFLALDDVV